MEMVNTWRFRTIKKPIEIDEYTLTQPDMNLSLQELVKRSNQGMAVPSLEPIYLSNTFVDIVGIEFKDTIERIEIVKDFVNKSKNNVEALEKELVKRKSEARESELTINNKSETEL